MTTEMDECRGCQMENDKCAKTISLCSYDKCEKTTWATETTPRFRWCKAHRGHGVNFHGAKTQRFMGEVKLYAM